MKNALRVTKQNTVKVLQRECACRSLAPPCDGNGV